MKKFYFKLFLVILFIIPTTSYASLIHYSANDCEHPPDTSNIMSTPDGSYSVNIFGSIWIESEPVVGPYPGGALETQYIFDINSFALNINIPDLGENLAFAGNGDSILEISTDHDPWGNLWLAQTIKLYGMGNFEYWWYEEWRIDNDFNGNLPRTIWAGFDDFWGGGESFPWTALVIGKDNWALLNPTIVLNQTPVPEPSTMLLLGSGLIGLVGLRRKFRKK